jgi:hypothetical protein
MSLIREHVEVVQPALDLDERPNRLNPAICERGAAPRAFLDGAALAARRSWMLIRTSSSPPSWTIPTTHVLRSSCTFGIRSAHTSENAVK